jgi:uncharacterized protein YcgI (DUF1989 family)
MKETIIPRCQGRAFELMKGETLRLIAHEGKQVGDLTALNLHDFREKFSTFTTTSANGATFRHVKKLYSRAPFFSEMLTVVDDRVGVHWLAGRCTKFRYKLMGRGDNHPNCHDNIVEALKPFGVSEYEVPLDTFNAFMVGDVDENNHYTFRQPLIEKGDYIELRAEMDLLVAISACPSDEVLNAFVAKPMKVEIRGA